MKRSSIAIVLAFLLPTVSASAATFGADSASFEFGTGNKTKMARIGLQKTWAKHWWEGNGTHLGGYWDLTLGRWRGTAYQRNDGSVQNIWSLGLTPVFRFERDSLRGPYAEAGIGAHYLSDLYDNNGRRLSTRFEFGDHIGVGYVFKNGLDLALKFQHFSNGGIKHPNSGVNFAVLKVAYPF